MLLGTDAFDEKASLKSVTRTIKDVKQNVRIHKSKAVLLVWTVNL